MLAPFRDLEGLSPDPKKESEANRAFFLMILSVIQRFAETRIGHREAPERLAFWTFVVWVPIDPHLPKNFGSGLDYYPAPNVASI